MFLAPPFCLLTPNLDCTTTAKLLRTVDLLGEFGRQLTLPHSKKISKNLYELRICGKIEVRIFYAFIKQEIVLLYGFIKKTRKIPRRHLKKAVHKLEILDTI